MLSGREHDSLRPVNLSACTGCAVTWHPPRRLNLTAVYFHLYNSAIQEFIIQIIC
jgi:hypothetical protein